MNDLIAAWAVYFIASLIFIRIYWQVTGLFGWRWLKYMLRAFMLALIYTPWYANSQGYEPAPALMIIALDIITIGPRAALRTFMPLVMGIFLSLMVAHLLYHRGNERDFERETETETEGETDEVHRH